MQCPKCRRSMSGYPQLKKDVCHYCDDYTVHYHEQSATKSLSEAKKYGALALGLLDRVQLRAVLSRMSVQALLKEVSLRLDPGDGNEMLMEILAERIKKLEARDTELGWIESPERMGR